MVTLCAILALATAAVAQQVPNAGLDHGGDVPDAWTLASGAGSWRPIDGDPALLSSGTDDQTSFWLSDAVEFVAGGTYRLSLSARRVSGGGGGTVMIGTAFANRDLGPIDTTWKRYRVLFTAPARLGDRARIRLGQWHLTGSIAFDDVRLNPLQAVHRLVTPTVRLGAGESIEGRRYTFRAPQRTELGNHSRPLWRHTAGFNTYRWVFSDTDVVHYRHDVGGHSQTGASVTVNVNYHTGGHLLIESRSGADTTWTQIGRIDQVGIATVPVPANGEAIVEVRLRATQAPRVGAEADPGSFQVDAYTYQATLGGHDMQEQGQTALLAVVGGDPEAAHIVDAGRLQPGILDTLTLQLGTGWDRSTLRTRVGATNADESPDGAWSAPSSDLRLPYRLTGTGQRVLHVELADSAGQLWHGQIDAHIASLHADDYGQLLAEDDTAALWWASSGWKVSTTRAVPTARSTVLRIEAARNEVEAAQLVLHPHVKLHGLRAEATDLVGPATIPSAAVELLQVGTVPVRQPTDAIGAAGDWPDPLLPSIDPSLPAQRNTSLWVRVTVPFDAAPGLYRGHIRLRAEDWTRDVPVHVEVFDFALPDRMTLQTAFGFSPSTVWRYHRLETEAHRRQVLELYLDSFARHHISPYDPAPLDRPTIIWPQMTAADTTDRVVEPVIDFSAWDVAMRAAIDERHFTTFQARIPGLGGGTYIDRREPELQGWAADTPQYRSLLRGYGRVFERHLRERGWLDEAFVYWFDEPAPRDYEFVMDGFARLQDAAPGLARMLTEQVEADLIGGPTLWCPVTPSFDAQDAQARRAEGERFWWYICTVPKAPYAGLFIDHPGTELRVWLWQTWKRDIDGILVWTTNYWTSGAAYPDGLQDPYRDPMSWESIYNRAPAGTRRPWGNGDGRFLYPPTATLRGDGPVLEGPVESLRWEMLRDGIEDYEYLVMLRSQLEQRGAQLPDAQRQEFETLLQVPDQISTSLTTFTHDPAPIEAHRRAVAQALEVLNRLD